MKQQNLLFPSFYSTTVSFYSQLLTFFSSNIKNTYGHTYTHTHTHNTQLGPILELWQQLSSSTPGLLNKKIKERDHSNKSGEKEPLIDFVTMESDLAGDLCTSIDIALNSLKKVPFFNLFKSNFREILRLLLLLFTLNLILSFNFSQPCFDSIFWSSSHSISLSSPLFF